MGGCFKQLADFPSLRQAQEAVAVVDGMVTLWRVRIYFSSISALLQCDASDSQCGRPSTIGDAGYPTSATQQLQSPQIIGYGHLIQQSSTNPLAPTDRTTDHENAGLLIISVRSRP